MTIQRASRWVGVAAAVGGLALALPREGSAQTIRVLLVMPRDVSELARQVARLEEAITGEDSALLGVRTLAEAEVVVQFTDFTRKVGKNGEPQDWWEAQYQLLVPPLRHAGRPGLQPPGRFVLVLFGKDQTSARAAAQALTRALTKALGREPRPVRVEI